MGTKFGTVIKLFGAIDFELFLSFLNLLFSQWHQDNKLSYGHAWVPDPSFLPNVHTMKAQPRAVSIQGGKSY